MEIRPAMRVIEVGHIVYGTPLQRTPLATEAQYLETTAHHLSEVAGQLAKQGLWRMERAYLTATDLLMSQSARFEADVKSALEELERKHVFERG